MINQQSPDYHNKPSCDKRPKFGYDLEHRTTKPAVSIITPFYNTNEIFHQTATSVLRQSFQQWEWIIVNDGTNNVSSLSILQYYGNLDSRIRIINHDKNKGLSTARNTGYREARANYVVQIDSDDLLEPTAIEKWIWFLESYPEYSFVKGYTVGFGAEEYLWNEGFHGGKEFLRRNLVNPTFAIRKEVYDISGGYNEDDFSGLMDWDLWLRCASLGFWGSTVPEYLDWYRRRKDHSDRWPDFDEGERQKNYWRNLKNKYSSLWKEGFPDIKPEIVKPNSDNLDNISFQNLLFKKNKRLLIILPWMRFGGTDKFNLSLLDQLAKKSWDISIIATLSEDHTWMSYYSEFTSDIFILPNFLKPNDYPRFIKYFIESRSIDVLMITQSELGYMLLPFIRYYFPEKRIIDYCHIEEEEWNNGGYPKMSVDYQDYLDLTLVTSNHLKAWIDKRAEENKKTEVCYINVDTGEYRDNSINTKKIKSDLGLSESKTVILYSARLCEQKQPLVLANTILELSKKSSDFICIVAGDGPDKTRFLNYIEKNDINEFIMYLGELSIDRMKEIYSISDIYFLPSLWEGISLSIYEAMSYSISIVSANVGGQSELVTSDCGFLIENTNQNEQSAEYSKILQRLISDKELRDDMGANCRNRVEKKFNINQMGENFNNYLDKILFSDQFKLYPKQTNADIRESVNKALENHLLKTAYNNNITGPKTLRFRKKILLILQRMYDPFYYWANRRNWKWHNKLSVKIKKILFKI